MPTRRKYRVKIEHAVMHVDAEIRGSGRVLDNPEDILYGDIVKIITATGPDHALRKAIRAFASVAGHSPYRISFRRAVVDEI